MSIVVKAQIKDAIFEVIGVSEVALETPENADFGDYSTNVAMQLFSDIKSGKAESGVPEKYLHAKSPRELAEMIVFSLKGDKELKKLVDRVEIAGPGFINFFLTRFNLVNELEKVLGKGRVYGTSAVLKGKRVMVEFGQPNTHKLPHIGHLFSYIYGESIARLLKSQSAEVFRANYQGDVGPHVAKCLWAYLEEKPDVPDSLIGKATLLQEMYVIGSTAYGADENSKKEIDEINRKIYAFDESIQPIWEETRQWSIDYYKQFEERLGIAYDRYFYESEVFKEGLNIVQGNVGKVFKESEGAVIFEGSKYGLHDRVFVTSQGTPTYEAKDMYLQTLKMKEWPCDLLIITTAHEQNEYFNVIFKALELLNPDFKNKLVHIGFGMVNLKEGKMSSRTGQIVGGVELVNTVIDAIASMLADKKDLKVDMASAISEIVGMGATKYSFLKNNPLQDTKFDINESISKEGNSGPYLQYTYARTQSVLRKANTFKGGSLQNKLKTEDGKLKTENFNADEFGIMRTLIHYPEVVQEAAEKYAPNVVCTYLYDLAQKYNTFYNSNRILNPEEGEEIKKFRLVLTLAVGQVLKNGLDLLGVEAPEKM
jgi:arginyl-tRNA synthetase